MHAALQGCVCSILSGKRSANVQGIKVEVHGAHALSLRGKSFQRSELYCGATVTERMTVERFCGWCCALLACIPKLICQRFAVGITCTAAWSARCSLR